MEVDAQVWFPASEGGGDRRQNRVHVGISLENRRETVLDDDRCPEIRPELFENFEGGRGQDAIAE
jgi:hypothetical protein